MDRGGGAPGDGDDIVAGLTRWLAEQRADAAAAARARERWLRQAAAEDATVAGVLLDIAERGDEVIATGIGGRVHRGAVRAIGEDFVVLRTAASDALVRVDALSTIRAERSFGDAAPVEGSTRPPALAIGFGDALGAVAVDRPRVVVVARDGRSVSGELRHVGLDVATMRLDDGGGTAFVPLAALAEARVVP